MPYRELQFTVVAEIAEPLGDTLMELGALSISVEDAAAVGMMKTLSTESQVYLQKYKHGIFRPSKHSLTKI